MIDPHQPLVAVSAAAALDDVRLRRADQIAAEAGLLAAITAARGTPGVTMERIAAEVGMTRDGLYKWLRARGAR